jgi:DNA-binding NarL/FixJ family response regulator
MRAILVGAAGERDRVRWQLERSSVTIVGEFPSLNDARASGIEADAFVVAPTAVAGRRSRSSTAGGFSDVESLESPESLTPREIQVLERLAEGLPNKAIAERLGISDQTVKFHVASISSKLGASNRTDAVRRGLRRGLIAL